jgi:pSer/pThr/pTyr-binding forkhead associated (FHA) protein
MLPPRRSPGASPPLLSRNEPLDARIRDIGSLNGTWVNGKKIGAREQGETPEAGQKRQYHATILGENS